MMSMNVFELVESRLIMLGHADDMALHLAKAEPQYQSR